MTQPLTRDFTEAAKTELLNEIAGNIAIMQEQYNETFRLLERYNELQYELQAQGYNSNDDEDFQQITSLDPEELQETLNQLEEEIEIEQGRPAIVEAIWENTQLIDDAYSQKMQEYQMQFDVLKGEAEKLIDLFAGEDAWTIFNEPPEVFEYRCLVLEDSISNYRANANYEIEYNLMYNNGNPNWGYIEKVMNDPNATPGQVAGLLKLFLTLDERDMERFLKLGYAYNPQTGDIEQTNTMWLLSCAAYETMGTAENAIGNNPHVSPTDYNHETYADVMSRLAILTLMGQHPTITVQDNYADVDVYILGYDTVGNPGDNGFPVRVTKNADGSYSVAVSENYPYRHDFDPTKPDDTGQQFALTGRANHYYNIYGHASGDNFFDITLTESGRVLNSLMPKGYSPGTNIAVDAAVSYVSDKTAGAVAVMAGLPATVIGVGIGVVKTGVGEYIDWVNDTAALERIDNIQDGNQLLRNAELLGATVTCSYDDSGRLTVHAIGFNNQEAFFRGEGYLQQNPGIDRQYFIDTILNYNCKVDENGERIEPTPEETALYNDYRRFLNSSGRDEFYITVFNRYEIRCKAQNPDLDEETVKTNFNCLSVAELYSLL